MGAFTSRKSAYRSINGTYVKVFCHVELAFHLAEALAPAVSC